LGLLGFLFKQMAMFLILHLLSGVPLKLVLMNDK